MFTSTRVPRTWPWRWLVRRGVLCAAVVYFAFVAFTAVRELEDAAKTKGDAPHPLAEGAGTRRRVDNVRRVPVETLAACERVRGASLDADGDGVVRLDEYFDRIFYVNDDRDMAKRDVMRAWFADLGVRAERVPMMHTSPDVTKAYDKAVAQPLTDLEVRVGRGRLLSGPASIALARTWGSVLRVSRARGYARILLLSDDVVFARNFTAAFDVRARRFPRQWRLLFLGDSATEASVRARGEGDDEQPEAPLFRTPSVHAKGHFALGVDHSAFDALLFELSKEVYDIDEGALRALVFVFAPECVATVPPLVARRAYSDHDNNGGNIDADAVPSARDGGAMSLYAPRPPPAPHPKVCVVVVVHNARATVAVSVRSLLAQTYPRVEVVVVDDASEDGSADIVTRIAAEDARVTLVRNARNIGAYPSRNVGLRRCGADAEVYANQDADDYSLPSRFAAQVAPILDGRAEATVAFHRKTTVSISDGALAVPRNDNIDGTDAWAKKKAAGVANGVEGCCAESALALCTLVVRLDPLKRAGGFPEHALAGAGALELLERLLSQRLGMHFDDGTGDAVEYLAAHTTGLLVPHVARVDKVAVVGPTAGKGREHASVGRGTTAAELDYVRAFREAIVAEAVDARALRHHPF